MTSPPDDTTTDTSAIIAALRAERDAALAREVALAEVLDIINSSPGDPGPVFEAILDKAHQLCGAAVGSLMTYDGTYVRARAARGFPEEHEALIRQPFRLHPFSGLSARQSIYGEQPKTFEAGLERLIHGERVFNIADFKTLETQPDSDVNRSTIERTNVRSCLTVPLRKDGVFVGYISAFRLEVRPFSEAEVALLESFAAQAVIAMENARLLGELRKRTGDLQESLEYQTATSDVLKVISRSAFDLQPVLDTVVETAARLCNAEQAVMSRREGEFIRLVANYGFPPEYEAHQRTQGLIPIDHNSESVGLRTIAEGGRIVHVHDVAAVPNYPEFAVRLGRQRTSLGVPLMREGEVIGAILLARQRVEPFTDRQIDLVNTFADQAVIAIENTRLITEQREALEQQTATAEVLQVINASPGNLPPVFDALLERALRLCESSFGILCTYDGEFYHTVATRDAAPGYADLIRAPFRPGPGMSSHGLVLGKNVVHVRDVTADASYDLANPLRRALADQSRARTAIWVALRRDDTLIGMINIYRREVRPYSDQQIALLENFASHAVIAMENARLIDEQREALERQTATAEVLQVINASPGNLAPVFDAMLERALRLCGAAIGGVYRYNGQRFDTVALLGVTPAFREYNDKYPMREVLPGSSPARMIETRGPVQNPDVMASETYRAGSPYARALAELGGIRSVLNVPLLKEGALLGFIAIYREEAGAFSDKQIALLEDFAAQAVIAMENARLITEQREALEQQTATAEVLAVINASPGNLTPVFGTILEKAMRLCGAAFGLLFTYGGEKFHMAATRGATAALTAALAEPWKPTPGGSTERLIRGLDIWQISDIAAPEWYDPDNKGRLAMAELGGGRSTVWVALRKDDAFRGVIMIYRQEVRPFTDRQIALLQNFAAQAVIAMENARLLTEQREALEQQTATAEVLQVINSSPGDLAPVFDAMLDKGMRLCGAAFGILRRFDGNRMHTLATLGVPAAYSEYMVRYISTPAPGTSIAEALNTGQPTQVLNMLEGAGYSSGQPGARAIADLGGARTVLHVPLVKDRASLGLFTLYRQEVRAFTGRQIDLLKNFAAQAVIAMENARLINEQREALEQQTATAEVLQVINSSPGNLQPVFEAILDKAHRICGAAIGSLFVYDGEFLRAMATHGWPKQFDEWMRKPRRPTALLQNLIKGERLFHIPDLRAMGEQIPRETTRFLVDVVGVRTFLALPLRTDRALLGTITAHRLEVRPFSEKEIALLENFAAQAVIAMENARLLDEIRQRQDELRVTFENMGDGVAMFDETQHLVAWNRKFQDILDVPDDIIARRQTFSEYVRYLAERGEYDPEADPEEHVRRLIEQAGQSRTYERTRPDGPVIEVRHNPVAGGGFVLIYADITERKRSEAEIRAARDAAEEASRTIEAAYRDLKAAQANLIQAEKMASLGQLTAGIAHEIKNPLNFVNNFSALSTELIDELRDVLAPEPLGETARTEVDDLTALLKGNLEKVVQHGQRADGIVRSMLDHSRGSSGERRMVDLNALIDEALNLAYHGARAQDQSFNITLERDFGAGIAPIEVNPQDMTRVFLNLFSNGFYATTRRARDGGDARFVPTLMVTTRDAGEAVEIRVRDNGIGIPVDIRDKLFQPFFTTKPTGEGTGLGLSITYDIVTQQHGGNIAVESKVGDYSEFTVRLPRNP